MSTVTLIGLLQIPAEGEWPFRKTAVAVKAATDRMLASAAVLLPRAIENPVVASAAWTFMVLLVIGGQIAWSGERPPP